MLSLLEPNTDIWWPQCIKWPGNVSYLTITPPCPGSWSISVASRLIVLTGSPHSWRKEQWSSRLGWSNSRKWPPLPLHRYQNSDGINTNFVFIYGAFKYFLAFSMPLFRVSNFFLILCGIDRHFTLFVMGMGSGFSKSEWYQKLAPGLQHCCLHWLRLYWQHREEGGCMTWPGNCNVLHLSSAFMRCPFSYWSMF